MRQIMKNISLLHRVSKTTEARRNANEIGNNRCDPILGKHLKNKVFKKKNISIQLCAKLY